MSFDTVIIGAGVNGLVTAAFLARAGRKVLVLERGDRVGGCARTTELVPGFRCPTLAHVASIDPAIVRALDLTQHGLRIIRPDADVCAPTAGDRALVLWRDRARAAQEIRGFSASDAERYPRFLASFSRIAAVLRGVCESIPPSIDEPNAADLFGLLKTGRAFRGLGKADAYRMLRWMPMSVADLADEWFESEPLRSVIAAGGILGSFLGPRSSGSAALLLLLGAGEGQPLANGWFAAGGPGALADALAAAARRAGAEIRTLSDIASINVTGETATGVTLTTGEVISARTVISNADPKRTLLGLVGATHLGPEFVRRMQNLRSHGTLAKVNYAVDALPRFTSLRFRQASEQAAALSGRIRLASGVDTIERAFDAAKYGGFAEEPWIELTIPSITDPALAPPGRHVVSAYVQYAPYHLRGSNWDSERDRLGDVATQTIARYAPGFESSIVGREVVTPLDLERSYGLTGGHIFHGELALDQFFVTRPLLGWARYATPIENLFLCGSGTHPGTGLDGRSGALAARQALKAAARSKP
ncbi:MAG TPA: NAD(P)/FAD-dependent oxidoreductase [Vicinamibacterales bacterium]|jgi:phytoene dehydrogenase-like protein